MKNTDGKVSPGPIHILWKYLYSFMPIFVCYEIRVFIFGKIIIILNFYISLGITFRAFIETRKSRILIFHK